MRRIVGLALALSLVGSPVSAQETMQLCIVVTGSFGVITPATLARDLADGTIVIESVRNNCAGVDVVPTPAPPPTASPAQGFGDRADAIGFMEGLGFQGEMGRLNTGEERWLAQGSPYGAEVIGPPEAVDRISLILAITTDTAETAADMAALVFARWSPDPEAAIAWVSEQFSAIAAGGDGGERRFGNVAVSVSGFLASDGLLVVVTLDHD